MKRMIAVAAMLLLNACGSGRPDVLIELKGASNVRYYTISGMKVLEYELREQYPAEPLIAEVQSRLKKDGWQPLSYIFLYPKYKSSHETGWAMFEDPPRNASLMIYEWSGDWEDGQKNIVTYTFRYKDPIEKYKRSTFLMRPGNTSMKVTAIYMTAAVAKGKQAGMNPDRQK